MKSVQDVQLGRVFIVCSVLGLLVIFLVPRWLGPRPGGATGLVGLWAGEQFADYWRAESMRFDHPEPNYAVVEGVAEFWSTVTTIPVAGVLLLWTAVRQDYQLPLCLLYAHVVAMYVGAFLSHMTLVPALFTATVSGVVANSLLAYFFWSRHLGGVFAAHHRLLSWSGALLGLAVTVAAVLWLQQLDALQPAAGFVTLAIVQPPFVFVGLCSAAYIRLRDARQPPYLVAGGALLLLAMAVSAVETFVDPLLVAGVPTLHLVVHVLEQLGIYLYGVGTACLHYRHQCPHQPVLLRTSCGFPRLLLVHNANSTATAPDAKCPFDLLAVAPRQQPHVYSRAYAAAWSTRACPVAHEPHCLAVFAGDEVQRILSDDAVYSSNPFPDERPVGLSTLAEPQHSAQRKLLARHFARTTLRQRRALFERIAQRHTEALLRAGGGDLVVDWAYRIAMASALAAMGVRDERLLLDDDAAAAFLDRLAGHARDMVRLVAPLGGMGPPPGVSLRQAAAFAAQLLVAVPPTLRLLAKLGPATAWRLLRPDLNLLPGDERTPRHGVFTCPDALASVPRYFAELHDLWMQQAAAEPQSAFADLRDACRRGDVSVADALLLIVQNLVSMTVANAMVNAVHRLLTDRPLADRLAASLADVPRFVAECLRLDAPLQRLPRRTTQPARVLDRCVDADTQIVLMIGACNRQADDDVDLDRADQPRSFTFGYGAHRCLGEELVRLEMQLAVEAWLAHMPAAKLSAEPGPRLANVDVGNYGFDSYTIRL